MLLRQSLRSLRFLRFATSTPTLNKRLFAAMSQPAASSEPGGPVEKTIRNKVRTPLRQPLAESLI
jgi:hypothetical protein